MFKNSIVLPDLDSIIGSIRFGEESSNSLYDEDNDEILLTEDEMNNIASRIIDAIENSEDFWNMYLSIVDEAIFDFICDSEIEIEEESSKEKKENNEHGICRPKSK